MKTERFTQNPRTGRSTRSLGALVDFLNAPRYTVGKRFLEGFQEGTEILDNSPVPFEVGKTYGGGWTGSRYVVVSCEKIEGAPR
ncbi:MAG: hypothetical protein ABL984_00370 [Pyrinomonadaceae bacterium]